MPRRQLARRFEPLAGVTEKMLETEIPWMQRELSNGLLLSINDTRERIAKLQTNLVTSEANLQHMFGQLPDRERLAIKRMLARDFYHIAALYEKFLAGVEGTGHTELRPEELKDDEPAPVVPFNEWLFKP